MLYILHSPGWKPIIFGKYKSGEGMQKDEVAVHQDQSHQPHLLAPKGFADSTLHPEGNRVKPGSTNHDLHISPSPLPVFLCLVH